ncbi:MAG: carboxypeptidase M32 [Oligoflexia bacterium]|nr:carboxypeptidase M32 [Oligoflexia bacterium]
MKTADSAWKQLRDHIQEMDDLANTDGLLSWDEHVWMPPSGGAGRGRQKALLSRLYHQAVISPELGEWLETIASDPTSMQDPVRAASVRNLRHTRDRSLKLPASLVSAKAEATSAGFAAWVQARRDEDFSGFQAPLTHIIDLSRQEAACLGPVSHPYDALIDHYDAGLNLASINALFQPLTTALVDLLDRIRGATPLARHLLAVPVDAQRRIHRRVVETLGFDLSRGRLDEAPHPFTMGLGPLDVRLTTRYEPDDLMAGLLATVHETGHGLYEQGLPQDLTGTFVDSAASTGVHESQSRFWENVIGRSRPFLAWLVGVVEEESGVHADLDKVYTSANRVAPSHIRVEADEVTYNLHIALRTRLEAALIGGELEVPDLPTAWADLAQELLGIRPQKLSEGVLQDVHWSTGLIGYFPSYTLGNIYSAALTERIEADLPDLWDHVAQADLAPILQWQRDQVHTKGHLLDGVALIESICPGRDPVAALVRHLERRHGALYGVARA